MADLQSRPYKPNPQLCCEACAFGRGEHAEWCWVCIDHELLESFRDALSGAADLAGVVSGAAGKCSDVVSPAFIRTSSRESQLPSSIRPDTSVSPSTRSSHKLSPDRQLFALGARTRGVRLPP